MMTHNVLKDQTLASGFQGPYVCECVCVYTIRKKLNVYTHTHMCIYIFFSLIYIKRCLLPPGPPS